MARVRGPVARPPYLSVPSLLRVDAVRSVPSVHSYSEREHVRVFHDQPAPGIDRRGLVGQLLLVVDDEQIAQRPVNQIEADVRAELLQVGVVLQQRVEERARVERVADARGDQVGDERRASAAAGRCRCAAAAVSNVR